MSYQVLARKWRPQNFQSMVGQEPILRMLMNALEQQRLHHAYLFTGTRGVGKTSLARIFAKCLNCETGITPNPCGTCGTCLAIDAGKFLDLMEIDAASRTKVEDTRELLENVQYPPTQGRFKVYLIDEVHMLSGHSFNALLKTLEEPPAHVKFLLATTDPKRLPITVLSRCLQFNLKRVPVDKIAQQLNHICTTEAISFEPNALELLAEAADGSMRDALSLMDQAIAYCGQTVTEHDTRLMLGNLEQDVLFRLLDALAAQDGKQLLQEINQLADYAPDFNQALEDLLSLLHQISVAQLVPEACSNEAIKQYANLFTAEDIQLYYQVALIGRRDLPYAPSPQQGFTMIMLRMLAFVPVTQETKTIISKPAAPIAAAPQTVTAAKKPQPATSATPVANDWSSILAQLGLSGMSQALAANCSVVTLTDNKIELALHEKHAPMLNKKLAERIAQAIDQYFKKPMNLDIKIAKAEIHTPAKQQQQEHDIRQANATESIKNDTQIQKIMDMFDATLDLGSIKAIDQDT